MCSPPLLRILCPNCHPQCRDKLAKRRVDWSPRVQQHDGAERCVQFGLFLSKRSASVKSEVKPEKRSFSKIFTEWNEISIFAKRFFLSGKGEGGRPDPEIVFWSKVTNCQKFWTISHWNAKNFFGRTFGARYNDFHMIWTKAHQTFIHGRLRSEKTL